MLADGSPTPVEACFDPNIELETEAGTLVLQNATIDVITSKCKDRLVLIGREEEKALGLRPMKDDGPCKENKKQEGNDSDQGQARQWGQ